MKKLTRKDLIPVGEMIIDLVEANEITSWTMISDKVRESYTVKNWMMVRSSLQLVIDQGYATRTANIHSEEYIPGEMIVGANKS